MTQSLGMQCPVILPQLWLRWTEQLLLGQTFKVMDTSKVTRYRWYVWLCVERDCIRGKWIVHSQTSNLCTWQQLCPFYNFRTLYFKTRFEMELFAEALILLYIYKICLLKKNLLSMRNILLYFNIYSHFSS